MQNLLEWFSAKGGVINGVTVNQFEGMGRGVQGSAHGARGTGHGRVMGRGSWAMGRAWVHAARCTNTATAPRPSPPRPPTLPATRSLSSHDMVLKMPLSMVVSRATAIATATTDAARYIYEDMEKVGG